MELLFLIRCIHIFYQNGNEVEKTENFAAFTFCESFLNVVDRDILSEEFGNIKIFINESNLDGNQKTETLKII